MKIKTISQLTPVSDKDVVHDKAYLAIAQYSDSAGDGANAYLSRKLTYKQLKTQIEDYVDSDLLEGRYGSKLYIDGGIENVNLSAMHNDIEKLKNGDMTIRGVKHFNEIPTIDAEVDPESRNSNIPNVKCVREMITNQAGYITDSSMLDLDPKNAEGYTVYDEFEGNKQMYWHIDHGQRDSSLYVDTNGALAGGVTCRHTGNLICYGWLADNGNVRPENAWVALFGQVLCPIDRDGNLGKKWVALQVQPWIVGKKSSVLQYVGFNIPVKAGLQLKIMTGFAVNGNNSGLSDRPTLMFAAAGTMPNTFVGYILHDDE